MVSLVRKSQDKYAAADVLYAYLPHKGSVTYAKDLVAFAEIAQGNWDGNIRILGATHYRAGDYDAAIQEIKSAPWVKGSTFQLRGWDWLFLAMAHQRLGHTQEAQELLKKAQDWINNANRKIRGTRGQSASKS